MHVAPSMRLSGAADISNWREQFAEGCAALWPPANHQGREGRASDCQDHAKQTRDSHALVAQQDDAGSGHFRFPRGPYLARSWTEAASRGKLQHQQRSGLR